MKNLPAAHAHISRRQNRLLVRVSCAGRVLWRSSPADMPEQEAVMRAVKRLFPTASYVAPDGEQKNGDSNEDDSRQKRANNQDPLCNAQQIIHEFPPPLRVAWWGRLP